MRIVDPRGRGRAGTSRPTRSTSHDRRAGGAPRSTSAATSATRRCASTSWATTPTSARPPTTRSTRMRAVVAESIVGGALGFSSDRAGFHVGDGGRPVPSIVATQDETEALMRVTAEIGQRHRPRRAGRELLVGLRLPADARPHDHVVGDPHLPARHRVAARPTATSWRATPRGGAAGADVWVQVTCRPILQSDHDDRADGASTRCPSFAPFVATPHEDRLDVCRRSGVAEQVSDEFDERQVGQPPLGDVPRRRVGAHPELVGRSVADLARRAGLHRVRRRRRRRRRRRARDPFQRDVRQRRGGRRHPAHAERGLHHGTVRRRCPRRPDLRRGHADRLPRQLGP